MAKPSSSSLPESAKEILSPTAVISKDVSPESLGMILYVFDSFGLSAVLPDLCPAKDFFSNVIAGVLKPLIIHPGHVTCLLTVKPSVINYYTTLEGGAIAAIAEAVSTACVRTVVAEDKEIFLGEQSISYLSAVHENAEVIVEANVVKRGRNLTIVAVDFRVKKTQQLVYQARAIFYNMPISKL